MPYRSSGSGWFRLRGARASAWGHTHRRRQSRSTVLNDAMAPRVERSRLAVGRFAVAAVARVLLLPGVAGRGDPCGGRTGRVRSLLGPGPEVRGLGGAT